MLPNPFNLARLTTGLRLRRVTVSLLFALLCFGPSFLGRLHLQHVFDHDSGPSSHCVAAHDHDDSPAHHHHDHHQDDSTEDRPSNHDPASCNVCLQLLLAKAAAASTADSQAFLELIEVADGRIIAVVKPGTSATLTEAAPRAPPRT